MTLANNSGKDANSSSHSVGEGPLKKRAVASASCLTLTPGDSATHDPGVVSSPPVEEMSSPVTEPPVRAASDEFPPSTVGQDEAPSPSPTLSGTGGCGGCARLLAEAEEQRQHRAQERLEDALMVVKRLEKRLWEVRQQDMVTMREAVELRVQELWQMGRDTLNAGLLAHTLRYQQHHQSGFFTAPLLSVHGGGCSSGERPLKLRRIG